MALQHYMQSFGSAKQTDTIGSANMGIFAENLRKTLNRKLH